MPNSKSKVMEKWVLKFTKMFVKSVDKKAMAGILDNYDSNNQIRIRYSCHDHYLQVYKKIKEERKNKKWVL